MGRLSAMPSRLTALAPRVSRHTDAEGHGQATEPWRSWYSLARWARLRMSVLSRDLYTCRCGCGIAEPDTSKLVADHIKPHRGDPILFWDPDNIQTLRASPCHNKWKQRLEREAAAS